MTLSLLVVLSLVLAACAAPAAPAPAAPSEAGGEQAAAPSGGTVVYGLESNFDKLDPNATTFTNVGRISLHVAEPLLWQTKLGEFNPGLATEWSVNEDATEYTLKLREGVKFHDGTPFNAEAVKFTFDRIVNPDTKSQTAFSLIGPYQETEVVDDYTVKVRFSTPYAPFLDSLSSPYLAPVSPTALQEVGEENWGITALVGTGPYKLESYTPDSEVVLVRNPDYAWAPEHLGVSGPANIEKIIYKIIAEPATRIASLETGETTFIETVPEIDFARVKEDPNFVTVEEPQPGSGWSLMMNQQNPPMDQLAVRRAIQLASDNAGMIATIWNGIGTPGCSPLTNVMFGFDPETCNMYPYNVDEANKALEEAGWVDSDGDGIREKDGQKLTIGHYYRAESPLSQQMADYMKADLAKIGIDVELNGLSRSGYFDAVRAGEHHTQNWWDTFSDPDGVRILFHSSNAGGGTNRNNYIDEEMDKLIDEAAGTPDAAKRVELYKQIQKKVADEAIMVFYNDPMTLYAHSNKLDGVIYYQGGNYPYFYTSTLQQ
jgi:peptide/nickel transport system substrate-binding protein